MVSKVSIHGRTIIPQTMRIALGIPFGGNVVFRIENGRVTLSNADTWYSDPVSNAFLDLIGKDIEANRNLRDLPIGVTTALRRAGKQAPADLKGPRKKGFEPGPAS